jgi:hypothetical protein
MGEGSRIKGCTPEAHAHYIGTTGPEGEFGLTRPVTRGAAKITRGGGREARPGGSS